MKIRNDFVTNSSSSSFIIATREEIPEKYDRVVKRVDSEQSALEAIKDVSDYEYTPVTYSMEDEDVQKLGEFTDKQMTLLKLLACNQIDRYQKLLKALQASDRPIYHIFADRDWLYRDGILESIIDRSIVIDEETDL